MRYRTRMAILRAARAALCPMILIGIIMAGKAETHCEPVQVSEAALVEPAAPAAPVPEQGTVEAEVTVTFNEDPELVAMAVPADPEPPYTDEELDALALAIYQEAGSDACSDEARLMVGAVVLNRVADDRYPDTIQEVLMQRAQYGRLHWTGLVWPERAKYPSEAHAVDRAYTLAEDLLSGAVVDVLPADVVFQAEFIQGTEVVAQIDGFYFCR